MTSASPVPFIPFNRAALSGDELANIAQAIQNGHISGDGPFSRKCHEFFQRHFGVQRALLTTSCTHALEMAALLLDLKPGDEVVVPSFTFVSTVNAFVMFGARPVFADIRPDTLNLDEAALERHLGPRTAAVVPVHYAGVACEMDQILAQAARVGAAVIEDNAHGLFGQYRGRNLGTIGALAAHSFHETKNFTCGEGGALFLNDPRYIERALVLREKGTNRSAFYQGLVDKYTWVDLGSSYLPSDILAAFLHAQLESHERIQARRRHIWGFYETHLRDLEAHGVRLPQVPAHCAQSYHMFYLLLPSLAARQEFLPFLKARGILSVFHYLPLHLSPMGRKHGGAPGDCPVTEDLSERLVRLPFYNDLSDGDLTRVVTAVHDFFRR